MRPSGILVLTSCHLIIKISYFQGIEVLIPGISLSFHLILRINKNGERVSSWPKSAVLLTSRKWWIKATMHRMTWWCPWVSNSFTKQTAKKGKCPTVKQISQPKLYSSWSRKYQGQTLGDNQMLSLFYCSASNYKELSKCWPKIRIFSPPF